MPTNQIKIGAWHLSYRDERGYVGWDTRVPPMQMQIQFHVEIGILTIDQVVLLDSDLLQSSANGFISSYDVPPSGPLADGQAYVTRAEVRISEVVTIAELKQGIYWAECTPPRKKWGVPRFAFQARSGVKFKAQTNYYSQKWSKTGGWAAPDPKPVSEGLIVHYRLMSDWSRLNQIGAHYNCDSCIQMPTGAGRDWVWYPPKEYQIYPPPAPPAPAPPKP